MSKSVRLMTSAASTGATKNTAITSNAGPTNHHATAYRNLTELITRAAREEPASLLENAIGASIEFPHGLFDLPLAADGLLGDEPHFIGDALPLRHLGRGLHAFELIPKRPRVDIGGECRVVPRGAPWRQVAGQRVEPQLDVGTREVFDQLPGRRLRVRGAKQDEARASRDRRPRARGSGQRRGGPRGLHRGRQPPLELADVPRSGDIERERAATE